MSNSERPQTAVGPCPQCGASAGEPCISPSGRPANIPHHQRTMQTAVEIKGWRNRVTLTIRTTEGGLISVSADQPRNLSVTGRTLAEAFSELVRFAGVVEEMGRPIVELAGVKLT